MEVFLDFLASGGYYRQFGQIHGIHKVTAMIYVKSVAQFFSNIAHEYINLPEPAEMAALTSPLTMSDGQQKSVILYVDGFIIKIQRPDHAGDAYFCGRPGKSCDGLNIQYVVDKQGRVRHIIAGVPGASHDKTALEWSHRFQEFLGELPLNYLVLGDPAYRGLHQQLAITLTGRNLNPAQVQYNNNATRLRQIVERTIGASQLKWRIQQLKENRLPAKCGVLLASQCAVAAAVLHNRFTNFL